MEERGVRRGSWSMLTGNTPAPFSTNAWSLAGAVKFVFPPGLRIPPCAPIVVCSTNPSAFRTQYGLGADAVVLGPWQGALNNAGDSLRLLRPGLPASSATGISFRADHVTYEPSEPWPSSDNGEGVSLERVTLEGYGNDPANWRLSEVGGTPGRIPPNRPPYILVTGSDTIGAGQTLRLKVEAADPDEPWQTVSLRAEGLPRGSDFDAASGALLWSTDPTEPPAKHVIRFVATDSSECAGASELSFVIDVRKALLLRTTWDVGHATPQFQFEGHPGWSYEVQCTDSLMPVDWRLLERIENDSDGLHEFRDPQPPTTTQRFYRVIGHAPVFP
jgi:hypothetical protein